MRFDCDKFFFRCAAARMLIQRSSFCPSLVCILMCMMTMTKIQTYSTHFISPSLISHERFFFSSFQTSIASVSRPLPLLYPLISMLRYMQRVCFFVRPFFVRKRYYTLTLNNMLLKFNGTSVCLLLYIVNVPKDRRYRRKNKRFVVYL